MQNNTRTKLSAAGDHFFDFDQNFENFNDCHIPSVPSISLSDVYNTTTLHVDRDLFYFYYL